MPVMSDTERRIREQYPNLYKQIPVTKPDMMTRVLSWLKNAPGEAFNALMAYKGAIDNQVSSTLDKPVAPIRERLGRFGDRINAESEVLKKGKLDLNNPGDLELMQRLSGHPVVKGLK